MILPRMPATCPHPHQTCAGSNVSYMKISCSNCGAVLYQNYMTQIDNWCVDHGCLLPKPEDSEYQQIMREMGECA